MGLRNVVKRRHHQVDTSYEHEQQICLLECECSCIYSAGCVTIAPRSLT